MYRNDRIRAALLWCGGVIAIGACLALIAFFVHLLLLRTSYRATCMEINDVILSVPSSECSIGRGDTSCPADDFILDYYDQFLLSYGTLVFNRRSVPATEDTIRLDIGDSQLLITGLEENAVNLRWIHHGTEQSYTVRAEVTTFTQLNAYYSNLLRRAPEG